ncbi:MAG: NAD-dependent epimerase/dehydratase family protein [Desulfobacterales bacterium]
MYIVITGSSGFVGAALVDFLIKTHHEVTAVDMVPLPTPPNSRRFHFVQADTTRPGGWQESIAQADAIVNLTGKNIFHRWNQKYKDLIYDTRILTTRHIVGALSEKKPVTLVSTSAAGYYGNCGDDILEEDHGPGTDFLARVCVDWEKEAMAARKNPPGWSAPGSGLSLARAAGFLAKMVPAFRMFVGRPAG